MGKLEGKRQLGRPRRRWVYNIRMDLCGEGCIGSWWGNCKERDHWGNLGVDGWIILGKICGERGCIGSWWGNRRERDHWGDLVVYGWIILGWNCGVRGCIVSLWGKRRERHHWGELGVDGCIIMGRICGETWVYRFLQGKPEGKITLGRPRLRWVDIIRMDLWGEGSIWGLGGEIGGKETVWEI